MLNHPVLGLFLGTMTPSGENTRVVLRQNSSSSKSKRTTSTGDAKLMSDKTISQGKQKFVMQHFVIHTASRNLNNYMLIFTFCVYFPLC